MFSHEYRQQFVYVDGQYEHRSVNSNQTYKSKWIRVPTQRVERDIIQPGNETNCFTSVQLYRDATSLRELKAAMATDAASVTQETFDHLSHDEQEEVLKRARLQEANRLPDQQVHWHGLYFDFDAKWVTGGRREGMDHYLEQAREDAIHLVRFFFENFDMEPSLLQTWFSGSKGFHVTVRPEFFAMRPHRHLTYMVRQVALDLKERFQLETLDMAVYSVSRMWRVPNTRHIKTGLYKIELTAAELMDMTSADIMEWAKEPRWDVKHPELRQPDQGYMDFSHLWDRDQYLDARSEKKARDWWEDYYEHYDAIKDMRSVAPKRPIVVPDGVAADQFPVCIQDLDKHGPKPGGPNRNRVLLPLIGFYHDAGLDQEEALRFAEDWTERHYGGGGDKLLRERKQNARSVVKAAYQGQVTFACRFIRSLSGTGKHGTVACVGEKNCPWVGNAENQEPKQTPMVHLSEATKGCYIGTKVRIPVLISAIQRNPYEITKKGEIHCQPNEEWDVCHHCSNNWDGGQGKLKYELKAKNRETLAMISVTDNHKKAAIKQMCGIPRNCYRHEIVPSKMGTVEEVQLIPMVDYAFAHTLTDDKEEDIAKRAGRHVVRIAYHVGHGIEANKKYIIDAYVYGHPRDQSLVFTFTDKESAQNDVDTFVMTNELYQKLLEFQPKGTQTVQNKMLEIHRDFEANVHQIGGRIDIAQAMDLCWHSVVDFKLLDKPAEKGWFELLVVGDSGTGKSSIAERLRTHFGLGELIAGEDAKRTGLVYASVQIHGQWTLQWGKMPQNDRRLLIIDEFSGIPEDEVARLTQIRSSGMAYGGGVNAHFKAWSRTRMMMISNPKINSGAVAGLNYGIDAISTMFKEKQDLRRVDLACIVDKSEVATDLINKRWDQVNHPHKYTADLCRSLVLWAWSRESEDVTWAEGAEQRVVDMAQQLGDTYECDIPLAERGDLRLKIARIAVAVACRLFSTDSHAKKVIVTPEHVQFAADFMNYMYRKPSMAFFEYARRYKQDNMLTSEKKKAVIAKIGSFDERDHIISTLLDMTLITRNKLKESVNLHDSDFQALWKYITNNRLCTRNSRGYRKTPAFTILLKEMGAAQTGYQPAHERTVEEGVIDDGFGDDEGQEPPY